MEFIAPEAVTVRGKFVFLAGAIDMGEAQLWQSMVASELDDLPVHFLNPRRLIWDISWGQTIEDPHFYEQVNWELDGLEKADVVLFYFLKGSKAPISLLELGLCVGLNKRVIACVEPGYYRRGNIEVLQARYGFKLCKDLSEATDEIRRLFE